MGRAWTLARTGGSNSYWRHYLVNGTTAGIEEIQFNPKYHNTTVELQELQHSWFCTLFQGIFVTKLTANGAAINVLQPGDKILMVNGIDFTHMEHNAAVNLLKQQPPQVNLTIERVLPTDVWCVTYITSDNYLWLTY